MAVKIIQAVPRVKASTAKKPKMMVGQGQLGGLNIMSSQNASSSDSVAAFWATMLTKAHSYYGFVDATPWTVTASTGQKKVLCDLSKINSGLLTHVVGPSLATNMTDDSYTEFTVTADGVQHVYRQYCQKGIASRAVLGMVENGQAMTQSTTNRMFGYSQGGSLWLNQREDCIKLGMYIPYKSSIKVEVEVFNSVVHTSPEHLKCGCALMSMDLEGLSL